MVSCAFRSQRNNTYSCSFAPNEYGRSTSMICSVLKRKESIKSVTPAKGLMIISKLRTSLHENMEKLLMVWVTEKQLQGDTLTQTIICEKAKAIYGDLLKQTPQTSIDEASEDMQVIGFEESEEEVISTISVSLTTGGGTFRTDQRGPIISNPKIEKPLLKVGLLASGSIRQPYHWWGDIPD
ncbi:hypothetical protein LAZ67_18000569 [Cordylochernes scorpioides]|uniref:HTH CENPB-type domain-containing protein n=1 Tax=Cordylochernes scorpioides TaxID=51811 RepID=A0ABY6LHL2_9ARAC|nr:hypothetical protein LAZ67_18000569 [Cordylochernes scorpioides]